MNLRRAIRHASRAGAVADPPEARGAGSVVTSSRPAMFGVLMMLVAQPFSTADHARVATSTSLVLSTTSTPPRSAVVSSAALPATPRAYRVVWDSWWPLQCYSYCQSDPVNVNLSSFGIEANGNGNGSMSLAHGRALTLWDSGLGLYPHWTCSNFPDPASCANTSVNGGVPQLAVLNLSAHVAKLRSDIDSANGCAECGDYSLDPDFDGLGVLDWETWDFAWSRMKLGGWDASNDIRVNVSIALVLADHPDMPLDQAEVEAGKRWDAAAKTFIEATLAALHELRPKGKFGFFGYPDCDGRFASPGEPLGCSAPFRAMNNELAWLWSSSSALYAPAHKKSPFG